MADCKWMQDEICVNAACPMRADYCPVAEIEGVCQFEDRAANNSKGETAMNYTNDPGKTIVMTNAERIRAMNNYELAWELMTWRLETAAKYKGIESHYPETQATILEWLEQPCEVRVDG